MEVQSSSWSSATNWFVAHGSLENSLTFESSISPIEGNADSNPKDHLILKPSSSDSGPCEIKINFSQRYEVRQVYVRSTARIYEIYYAVNLQSSNEYLCTVRCSIASKANAPLHESDIREAMAAHEKGFTEQLTGEKANNNITNEDDWVEVKVPDSAVVNNGGDSLPRINDGNIRSIQDFYEATAEITDGSPCNSLTLRLLSLQTEGYVHIEEIYIFADPVLSTDADHQVGPVENSSGSSLMAMLVPTLMQLSNSRISRIHDKDISDTRQDQRYHDSSKVDESKNPVSRTIQPEGESIADQEEVMTHEMVADATESAQLTSNIADRQSVRMKEAAGTTTESIQLDPYPQVSVAGNKSDSDTKENYSFYNHLEGVLDQLVCRVGRIEAFCLRFEESMLKPLNSMDTRLQRLEQQLEVITMRSQASELLSCTRFAAPEFSCDESESNSCYNGNNGDNRKDIPPDKSSFPFHDVSVSVDSPQLFPHLVVTAPEFSNGDDDEDDDKKFDDASELVKQDCSTDKPKPLSIDDALASALAGLLLSTPSRLSKISQFTSVEAPEFADELDGSNEKLDSPNILFEKAAGPSDCFFKANRPENVNDSDWTPCNNSYRDRDDTGSIQDECAEDSSASLFNESINPNHSFMNLTEERRKDTKEENSTQSQLFIEQKDDRSLACTDFATAEEVLNDGSNKDLSDNNLEQTSSPVVDFKLQLLDVKFIPQENWSTRSPLEALLCDALETKIQTSCGDAGTDGVANAQQNPIFWMVDRESVPIVDGHLLVEMDDLIPENMAPNMDGEEIKYSACSNQEPATSLI